MQNITRYFSLEGRASRKEWWAVQGTCILLGLAIIFPTAIAESSYAFKSDRNASLEPDPAIENFMPVTSTVTKAFSIAYFLIFIATSVRRLHDMDRSGWWWLVFLVPGIGQFIFTIWVGFFPPVPGENIPNRYG